MPIFFLKSLLAIVIFIIPFVQLFTMFEVIGRSEKRFNVQRLLWIHRVNGYFYIALSLFIAYLCLNFTWSTGTELSARTGLHSMFAVAIFSLLFIKIIIVRIYKGWYGRVPVLGLLIALLTFQLVAGSAGYYFLVTHFGGKPQVGRGSAPVVPVAGEGQGRAFKILVKTDGESIGRGKKLFHTNCSFCHDPDSTKTTVGPGLQGVLKRPALPVSGRPAIPDNVYTQLKQPYKNMPSFAQQLTDNEILDLIAFLNTR